MDKGQRSEGSGHNELEYNSLKLQHIDHWCSTQLYPLFLLSVGIQCSACLTRLLYSIQFNSISLIQATWPIQEHERQMNRQKAADRKNSTTQKKHTKNMRRKTEKTDA